MTADWLGKTLLRTLSEVDAAQGLWPPALPQGFLYLTNPR